jgi:hypothetical protein
VALAGAAVAGVLLGLAAGISGCANDALAQTAVCSGATALQPGETVIDQVATTYGDIGTPPAGFGPPTTLAAFAGHSASEPMSWCVTSDSAGLNARCAQESTTNTWERAYLIDLEGHWVRVPPDLHSGRPVTPCP